MTDRGVDRVQRREVPHGTRLLTGLVPRRELAADLRTRLVDRAPRIVVQETARLVEGQGMEAIGPPRGLQPGGQLLGLAGDPGLSAGVRERREDQIGAAACTAPVALV